ncbi:hypothetical protein Y032_0079g1252 [Ancylostoma ceylanicum]|nr:hypothetical protein Y032_0079g1252 [Ancylostoma ceylanicum]
MSSALREAAIIALLQHSKTCRDGPTCENNEFAIIPSRWHLGNRRRSIGSLMLALEANVLFPSSNKSPAGMIILTGAPSAIEKTQTQTVTMSSESGTPYTIATKCAAEFVAVMAFVTVGSLQAMNTGDGIVRAALCHGPPPPRCHRSRNIEDPRIFFTPTGLRRCASTPVDALAFI